MVRGVDGVWYVAPSGTRLFVRGPGLARTRAVVVVIVQVAS